MRLLDSLRHIGLELRPKAVVLIDEVLRLGIAHMGRSRQAMLAHPIEHPKVYHLGPAALLLCHHVEWYSIDLRGGVGMDIDIGIKIANHRLLPRQHRRQAQLKLRIVSIDKHIARRWHKGIANVPP